MGRVMSMVARKAQGFNVENRAHRVLDQEKPIAAPRFESNLEDMKRALEVDPQLVEKLSKKDAGLDNRLKNVYVTSEDSYIDYAAQRKTDPNRPLPLNRTTPEFFEYGYQEPTRVSIGRCTLRQALQFITDSQSDPEVWTAKKIADDYKLKEQQVEKILLHFKSFSVYIPDKRARDSILKPTERKLLNDKDDSPPL